jgi:hypothetical protein
MASMLDQLGVPKAERRFSALQQPLAGGVMLPAPSGIFPRHIQQAV